MSSFAALSAAVAGRSKRRLLNYLEGCHAPHNRIGRNPLQDPAPLVVFVADYRTFFSVAASSPHSALTVSTVHILQ